MEKEPLIHLEGQDPFEYDLKLLIREVSSTWETALAHWRTGIGHHQGRGIAAEFAAVLN